MVKYNKTKRKHALADRLHPAAQQGPYYYFVFQNHGVKVYLFLNRQYQWLKILLILTFIINIKGGKCLLMESIEYCKLSMISIVRNGRNKVYSRS